MHPCIRARYVSFSTNKGKVCIDLQTNMCRSTNEHVSLYKQAQGMYSLTHKGAYRHSNTTHKGGYLHGTSHKTRSNTPTSLISPSLDLARAPTAGKFWPA